MLEKLEIIKTISSLNLLTYSTYSMVEMTIEYFPRLTDFNMMTSQKRGRTILRIDQPRMMFSKNARATGNDFTNFTSTNKMSVIY